MTRAADLVSLFKTLRPPSAASGRESYSAAPIPECPHRIAADPHGRPALLLHENVEDPVPAHSISLRHLEVRHGVACRIFHKGQPPVDGAFTVIQCTAADPALHNLFLRLAGPIVDSVGPQPSRDTVRKEIASIVELFRVLSQPSRKSAQGLWGELFLLASATDLQPVIQAWHVLPDDRYDFNSGDERVEVKTAGGRVRQHHFSLDQLLPPDGVQLLVASIFVQRAGGGTSLQDLCEEIRGRLPTCPELTYQLDKTVFATLGENYDALEERFDREVAAESLRFFAPDAIPRISASLPRGVSDVHFKSDLTGCPLTNIKDICGSGALFQGLAPR